MTGSGDPAEQLAATLYDIIVPDWADEIAFYRRLAAEAAEAGQGVLEVACGTGRVARRLADVAPFVVGVDHSEVMLAVARAKSVGLSNIRFELGDMRTFALADRFGLAIVPGHAFQFMRTADDQLRAVAAIARHLEPDGRLVLHFDVPEPEWLDELPREGAAPEPGGVVSHPTTGERWRPANAWSYEPETRTATLVVTWDRLDPDDRVVETLEEPARLLHCPLPEPIGEVIARSGLATEAVLGDFGGTRFGDGGDQMIWVTRKPGREAS